MRKSDLKKLLCIGAAVTAAAAATAAAVAVHKRGNEKRLEEKARTLARKNAYITGGGLSALAAALYLVRDCGMEPENVHVFTNGAPVCGNERTGYICRRGKVINEKNSDNFFDLIKDVQSPDIPELTVCDEILNLYRVSPARNITFIDENGNVNDMSKIKAPRPHVRAIAALAQSKRSALRSETISDRLPQDFFSSQFWKILSAAYGFTRNSGAYELISCIEHVDKLLTGTFPAEFDRCEEIISPLTAHLKKKGVDIRESASVTDIDFDGGKADAIHLCDGAVRKTYYLNEGDIVIIPTDNMGMSEALGSFNESAPDMFVSDYDLWYRLSRKNSAFKDPYEIFNESEHSKSEEFTITLSNRLLPELIDKVTCGALGGDGIIVLDNSAWKMTICAVPNTHFKSLNEDICVIWGTAMQYERDGDTCDKPMTNCSGAEILYELISCLRLDEVWDDIRETVINVIPCHRRYARANIAPIPSKLEIIPTGISNLAVSGDFAEDGDNTVFSEEYAAATARRAAYSLMRTNKKLSRSKAKTVREIKKSVKKLYF